MSNRFAFIIQARSGSKRLPNKILLPFYNNKTILDIQIENLQKHFPGALIILATTTNKADDVIEKKYSGNNSINIYRGEEENVLKRFIDAAKTYGVENIVRICSDNPFLSMLYCDVLIDAYFKTLPDYTSYRFSNGIPSIKSHCGLFAEIVSLKTLEVVLNSSSESLYYEHVTNYIYSHPNSFKIDFLPVPNGIDGYVDKLRLTIDTESDFANLQKLYLAVLEKYGENYTVEQLLTEVDSDKELVKIMTEQIRNHAK
jgi:spore coat polysaccharide biosynthesis protein SpsF (cytidylyltransferase family)